jgi:hypothetical protein
MRNAILNILTKSHDMVIIYFMDIFIDLQQDFMKIIMYEIAKLRKMGFNFENYNSWKKNKGSDYKKFQTEQLMAYANLMERIPKQIPRNVFRCKTFYCEKKYEIYLKELEEKIKSGSLLLPYLSRKIVNPLFCDELLFDFGIVHFHLGNKRSKKNKIFIEGMNKILYAFIDRENCYFIEINNHNKFSDINLLKNLNNSFPNLLEKWKIKDMKPTTPITSEDRIKLRSKHVNTLLEIDGNYYVSPGWGMSLMGTSPLANLNMART